MAPREVSVPVKDGSSVNTSTSATQSKPDSANRPASVSSLNRASKKLPATRKTRSTSELALNTAGSVSRSASLLGPQLVTPTYPRRTQERTPSTAVPPPPSSVPYFFNWNPPSVVNEGKIKGSVSSRGPRFYDMHLHEGLLLKKVVLVPDMASQIASVVDLSLEKHHNVLLRGRRSHSYPTKMILDGVKIRHTQSESEVQGFYQDKIAPACMTMASMLGLGIKSPTVFRWGVERPEQKRAMADGFLSFETELPALRKDLQAQIDVITYWKLDILVLWEFKSLAVGCRSVMMAIRQLALEKSFLWTACTSGRHCNSQMFHPRDDLRYVKTGRKTGPDARSPPWTFMSPRKEKRSFDDMCDLDDPGNYLSEEEDEFSDGDLSEEEYPATASSKEFGSQKETDVTRGHNTLQQGWAEAVQCDATFIVINAGQYEFIGIRHRKSQTLYLSDMIKICESNPAYGKLHTGLYIVAFQDALDRAGQLRDIQRSPCLVFDRLYNRKYRYDRVKYNHPTQPDTASQSEEVVDQAEGQELLSIISRALQQNLEIQIESELRPLLDYKIQKFRRLDSEGTPFYGPDGPHTFLLMLEPLTDTIYDCVVMTGGKSFGNRFVLKLAVRDYDQAKLCDEHVRYLWLKEQGFTDVVEMFGLFGCEVEGMLISGLLLSHGGVSLFQPAGAITKTKLARLQPQVNNILKNLKRHGIIHRGLLLEHFLASSTDRLSLISWALADVLPPVERFEEGVGMDQDDLKRLGLTGTEMDKVTYLMGERRSKWRDWELKNETMIRGIRKAFKLE